MRRAVSAEGRAVRSNKQTGQAGHRRPVCRLAIPREDRCTLLNGLFVSAGNDDDDDDGDDANGADIGCALLQLSSLYVAYKERTSC